METISPASTSTRTPMAARRRVVSVMRETALIAASFAAKAERADGLEPALVRELARRVAQKAHARVLRRHADAVVRDADIVPPSGAELKHDGARPASTAFSKAP